MTHKHKKDDSWRQNSPRGFLSEAKSFRDVARDALKGQEKIPLLESFPSLPVYYLFLHSIELSLKAYILQVEKLTIRQLRSRYGHDISKLLSRAILHGLASHCVLDEEQMKSVRHMADYYKNKQLEYFELMLFSNVPSIAPIARAADDLINGIGRIDLRIAEDQNRE